jgi:vitamin K-dependent gamma-carboxylase
VLAFFVASAAISEPAPAQRDGWTARLFAPVDIAALVFFRIVFGAILAADVWLYFHDRWIDLEYIQPKVHFTYYGFEWVHPWPGNGMYYHFAVLGVLAICIMAGFLYRVSAVLFFLGFTYVFLLEQATYLNHYYFVGLVSFLMIFVPAHRSFSLDAMLRPGIRSGFAPAWSLWCLRAQMGVVYFFGGMAKLNSDWLQGWPLRIWMPRELNLPVLWRFRDQVWLAMAFSYSGLLLDLLAVPLLLWRRTRPYMFGALALFHLTNSNLFDIGIFPWFATAITALYFEPDWPRRLISMVLKAFGRDVAAPAPPAAAAPRFRTATLAGLAVFFAIQILLPLRHWLYPGDVAWTDQGHRFSWRMKLRDKQGVITLHVTDPETGRTWNRSPSHYLSLWQYSQMLPSPDMIQQFAQFVADQETQPGHARVQVRVDAEVSLNGRRRQPMIDPDVDLGSTSRSLLPATWITELTAQRRRSLVR